MTTTVDEAIQLLTAAGVGIAAEDDETLLLRRVEICRRLMAAETSASPGRPSPVSTSDRTVGVMSARPNNLRSQASPSICASPMSGLAFTKATSLRATPRGS